MSETFDRRSEICANPLDQEGIEQLSNMLRHEFLDKPSSKRKFGPDEVATGDGNVNLSTYYTSKDGSAPLQIGPFGMTASVHCPEKDKYTVVSLDPTGKLRSIDVAKDGKWVLEIQIEDFQK